MDFDWEDRRRLERIDENLQWVSKMITIGLVWVVFNGWC
jgi:hypothetical protein